MSVGLIACVRDQAEAAAALEAGFAGVLGAAPTGPVAGRTALIGRIEDDLLVLEGHGLRRLAVFRDAVSAAVALGALQGQGYAGLLLTTADRLLEAVSLPELAGIADRAGAAGLTTAFAGGLEAPDIPRLAAIGADFLLIGRALRTGAVLDPGRMRAMALVAAGETTPPVPPPAVPLDRIFVRDLVRDLPIGAYASEVGRAQRVRFSVEADITPVDRAADTMADIVSYDLITDAIARASSGAHTAVVETLAERIAALVLRVPRIVRVWVRVEKLDLEPGSAFGIEIDRRKGAASL